MWIDLPPKECGYYPSGNYHTLHPDLNFVFGSNLFGRHGKGSALTAKRTYGAVYGVGVGLRGRSYAIPTKDGWLRVLDLKAIKNYVDEFVEYTLDHPEKYWFVTPVGTGLAGYSHKEIAPLFKGAINCWFDEAWKPFM